VPEEMVPAFGATDCETVTTTAEQDKLFAHFEERCVALQAAAGR